MEVPLDLRYQALLISGTNIKTINTQSILGSGDLTITANPAGSSTWLQYNLNSSLSATSALAFSSSTASLYVGGKIGIATATPQAFLDILGTTTQLRLGYDLSHYALFTIGSTGNLTLNINGVDGLVFDNMGNIQFKAAPLNASSSGNITTMYVADNNYGFGALLYVNATGSLSMSKGSVTSTMPALFMAVDTGVGASKRVLELGFARSDSWNFATGTPVYVSTSTFGAPTTTQPLGSGSVIQQIGVTTATNTIYFNPNNHTLGL